MRGETDRSASERERRRVRRRYSVGQSVGLPINRLDEGGRGAEGRSMYRCNNLVGHSKGTSVTL